jgi:hypothetical protein
MRSRDLSDNSTTGWVSECINKPKWVLSPTGTASYSGEGHTGPSPVHSLNLKQHKITVVNCNFVYSSLVRTCCS